MATLGIDTSNKLPSLKRFERLLKVEQKRRVNSTWILCDLNLLAKDNPEYDDVYQQFRDEAEVADSTITKYNATVKDFPISRRKWYMSIDLYYSVSGLRDKNGNPLVHIQDNLLSKVYQKKQSGEKVEGGIRKWLRDEVKKVKREPIIETETITATVGNVDDVLRTWHKLPDGYEVQVKYVKQVAYEQSELEDEITEMKKAS